MSEATQAETMDIVEYAAADPVSVLTDERKYGEFLAFVKGELAKHEPDTSTDAGRKEIKSLAYKVIRTKTTIDDAGKKLNEERRKQINAVDAQRRKIREELDALATEVRRPVTEYEEAENERRRQIDATYDVLSRLAAVPAGEGSDAIAERIEDAEAVSISESVFRDQTTEAETFKDKTVNDLRAQFERTKKQEENEAELARLRAENEERERAAAEAERKAKEAAEQAREEEHRKAEAEKQRVEYYHAMIRHIEACGNGVIDGDPQPFGILYRELEEKIVIDDTWGEFEQDALAAKEAALAKLKAAREAQERREAEEAQRREEEKRAADKRHRATVMREVRGALMGLGADKAAAKAIVEAIVAGHVPHTSIRF